MDKYKVGDKVIGNKKANEQYSITKEGWVGEVIGIVDRDEIIVGSAEDPYGFEFYQKSDKNTPTSTSRR